MTLEEARETIAEARKEAARAREMHEVFAKKNLARAVGRLADVVEKLCELNLSLLQRK